MAPRMPQEARDLIDLTRRGIGAVDAVLGRFWADVQRVLSRYANRPLVKADRLAIMRQLDTIINRVYGLTRQAALISSLFATIVRVADVASDTPFARMIERTRNLVERRQPGFWQRIRGRAAVDPYDPFLKVVAEWEYVDEFGNRIIPQSVREGRLVRSRNLDPNRRWVDGDSRRLSDRVWRQGAGTRRAIDARIVEGIRRGEDALSVSKDLEQYLNPELQPTTIRADGKVVRRNQTRYPGRGGYGSFPARRLAQTEISHAYNAATHAAGKVTPGALGGKWNTSSAHDHPDECTAKASNSSPGMNSGEYTFDEFPVMPSHPMCRCFETIVLMSREQMVDMLIRRYA